MCGAQHVEDTPRILEVDDAGHADSGWARRPPAGVGPWDMGIVGEQIAAVTLPGMLPAEATRVIDARGKIVVPGGIETHAHAVANVQPGGPAPWCPACPTSGRWSTPWGPSGVAQRR